MAMIGSESDGNIEEAFLDFLKAKVRKNLKAELMATLEREVDAVLDASASDFEIGVKQWREHYSRELLVEYALRFKRKEGA